MRLKIMPVARRAKTVLLVFTEKFIESSFYKQDRGIRMVSRRYGQSVKLRVSVLLGRMEKSQEVVKLPVRMSGWGKGEVSTA